MEQSSKAASQYMEGPDMSISEKGMYYFGILAKTLSFTKAADTLFMSQQAMSKQIRLLEEEVGVQLVERKPKVHLTPAGIRLLEYYQTIQSEEARLKKDIALMSEGPEYRRIAASMAEGRTRVILPNLMNAFQPLMRRVVCDFVSSGYSTASRLLQSGAVDLYFGMLEACLQYGVQTPLWEEQFCLIVPFELLYRLPVQERIDLQELAVCGVELERVCTWPLPWVMPNENGRLGQLLKHSFEDVRAAPEVAAYAYPFETALDLCSMGMGMAIAFRTEVFGAAEQLQNRHLAVLPLREVKQSFTLGLVTKSGWEADPELMDYVECAKRAAIEVTLEIDSFFNAYCPRQTFI